MERNTRLELEGGEICCESIISIGYLVENGCGMKKTVRKHSKKNPSTKPNKRYLEHREALAAQFKTGKIGMKRMRTKKIMATVGTKLEVVPTVRMENRGIIQLNKTIDGKTRQIRETPKKRKKERFSESRGKVASESVLLSDRKS